MDAVQQQIADAERAVVEAAKAWAEKQPALSLVPTEPERSLVWAVRDLLKLEKKAEGAK